MALQALDTLTTQLSEHFLTVKIQENFEWVIEKLSAYNKSLMLQAYFDFLAEFIKTHYSNFTLDNLNVFLEALVARVQSELQRQEKKQAKGKTLNVKS